MNAAVATALVLLILGCAGGHRAKVFCDTKFRYVPVDVRTTGGSIQEILSDPVVIAACHEINGTPVAVSRVVP